MAVCDSERDIRRLCDLFSSWYAALTPVVISGHDMILTWILGFDDLFLFTNSVWISQNCSRIDVFSRNVLFACIPFVYFSVVYPRPGYSKAQYGIYKTQLQSEPDRAYYSNPPGQK